MDWQEASNRPRDNFWAKEVICDLIAKREGTAKRTHLFFYNILHLNFKFEVKRENETQESYEYSYIIHTFDVSKLVHSVY